jgi:hypothetical protein
MAVLLFSRHSLWKGEVRLDRAMRAFQINLLCAVSAAAIYLGVSRYRVETTGPGVYFQRNEAIPPGQPFFSSFQGSAELPQLLGEVQRAIAPHGNQPVFFGPRLEFCYAVFGLQSPTGLPLLWDPGSLFPEDDEPMLLDRWREKPFALLLFAEGDMTYYSPAFVEMINEKYVLDPEESKISVYRPRERAKGISAQRMPACRDSDRPQHRRSRPSSLPSFAVPSAPPWLDRDCADSSWNCRMSQWRGAARPS